MKKGIIDRFEGEIAVIEFEDGTYEDITKEKLPPNAAEGDVLYIENGKITIDKGETDKLKKEIEKLMDDLFK